MEIKEVQSNKGNVDVVATVVAKDAPREFEKFGKKGKVCNAKIKDATGMITLTLWNEDVEKVKVGDKIHLENGWCSEYKSEKQLSAGKFGKIEILGSEEPTLFTNDPKILQGSPTEESGEEESAEEEPVDKEEYVE